MAKQSLVMRGDEGEELSVLGCGIRFLCTADKTDKAWSLMETVLAENAGPPLHDHPWDEAYYVVEGEVRFTLGERELTVKSGDFIYAPAGTLHAFQGASAKPARVLVFDAPAHAEIAFPRPRSRGQGTAGFPEGTGDRRPAPCPLSAAETGVTAETSASRPRPAGARLAATSKPARSHAARYAAARSRSW